MDSPRLLLLLINNEVVLDAMVAFLVDKSGLGERLAALFVA